ncbi:MAG: hypothetical protein IPJ84_12755 [Bdellovibrionales bacterium]|nr:hypothetical protein [Bdellovibrionales bacterium]
MNKFCTIVFCAFASASLSCATPPSPTVSSIPENSGPKASAPSEATGNTQKKPSTETSAKTASHSDSVLTYFYKLYPEGSGKPFDQLVFEDQDIKNGYLRVTGAIEGHYVFALFKSPNADWLIEQRTGCGPECDQTFKVYRFVNGKREETKTLESLYPQSKVDDHVAELMKKLPKGHTGEALQSWFRLPKSGTSIDILIVEQNPGHTVGKVGVYEAGRLIWNGSSFDFKKLNPGNVSSIDISNVR